MFILTAFTFPISESGRGFHDKNKDLVSSNKGLKLTLNKSAYLRVTGNLNMRYLMQLNLLEIIHF